MLEAGCGGLEMVLDLGTWFIQLGALPFTYWLALGIHMSSLDLPMFLFL